MSINQKTTIKESSKKITAANLIRWSGLAAMMAGIIFVAIQPIHPADVLSSVTTSSWAAIMFFKTAMSILFVYGITGLYARQVEESGWLGLTGFLMFSLTWMLHAAFIFAEAFILPLLATAAPAFVESFLGLFNGSPGAMDLGAFATVYSLAGILYILGGLLLGIATLRARVLPRWPAVLLTIAAAMTPAASLLSHPLNRIVAVPMGLAFVWLGYALWSEGRGKASESSLDQRIPKPEPSKAA
jgi:hypothetical protein